MADGDLDAMPRERLLEEARKLRAAIRSHRDATKHDLCWHQPDMWALLPDKPAAKSVVPEWPQFLEGCILYRRSLDKQAPEAPRTEERFKDR